VGQQMDVKNCYDLFCIPTEGGGQKDIIMIYQWETGGNQAGLIASGLPANRSHRPHFLLLPLSDGITMSYSSEKGRETDKIQTDAGSIQKNTMREK
jgi:hypothetical protein